MCLAPSHFFYTAELQGSNYEPFPQTTEHIFTIELERHTTSSEAFGAISFVSDTVAAFKDESYQHCSSGARLSTPSGAH